MRWLTPGPWPPAGEGIHGDRPPAAVLLHGIPTSAELWRGVLPGITAGPAAAWELVGYGASIPAGRDRDISVARQADYLRSWLRYQGIDRVVLAGHDLGGGIAQLLAVREPGLCAGLVLANCIAYRAWPVLPVRLVAAWGPILRRVPEPAWRTVYRSIVGRLHPDRSVGRASVRVHWAHYARHGAADALVRQARSLRTDDTGSIASRLPVLDLPVRVLWGDADPFLSMELAARLARDLGTAVQALPGAGHFTPEDRPKAIAGAVNAVVREASAAPLDGDRDRT